MCRKKTLQVIGRAQHLGVYRMSGYRRVSIYVHWQPFTISLDWTGHENRHRVGERDLQLRGWSWYTIIMIQVLGKQTQHVHRARRVNLRVDKYNPISPWHFTPQVCKKSVSFIDCEIQLHTSVVYTDFVLVQVSYFSRSQVSRQAYRGKTQTRLFDECI